MFTSLLMTKAMCQKESPVENRMPVMMASNGDLIKSLVAGRTIAAATTAATGDSCEFGSFPYFALCGLGGALCCGSTHIFVLPLDIVKCRLQVDSEKYRNVFYGIKLTYNEEGPKGLIKGWFPTMIGYGAQGYCKFGFYEVFKVLFTDMVGEENAYLYRTWLYLAASFSAEFIGDILLSPMEAVKVKIQTTQGYANTLREAAPKMYAEEGWNGFYKSLVPLWMRQIPYTMMKFVCFERTVEYLYRYVIPKPRDQCTKSEQLLITFGAGYIAGIFCAIASHPGDTLVSKLNQKKGGSMWNAAAELGFIGIWKGLGARIVMVGTLSALQWFIYDAFKVSMRLPRPPPPEMPESLKKRLEAK